MIKLTEIFMFCFSHVDIKKNAQGVGCHPCTLNITPRACFSMYACLPFCLSVCIHLDISGYTLVYPGSLQAWDVDKVHRHACWLVCFGLLWIRLNAAHGNHMRHETALTLLSPRQRSSAFPRLLNERS